MKMNIKGLVFVGFAAAVFAGAANAATDPSTSHKTVTSLKYTDATYEKLNNKVNEITDANKNSTDNYPSNAALTKALTEATETLYDSPDNSLITVDNVNHLIDTTAQVNVLEGVKVNGTGLTVDASKNVNVTVETGATSGSVAVNGTDVAVKNVEITDNKVNEITDANKNSTDNYPSNAALTKALTEATETLYDSPDNSLITVDNVNHLIDTTAQVNVLEGVKVNGTGLTVDASKNVNVTVETGATSGSVAVNGTDVAVKNVEITDNKLKSTAGGGVGITSNSNDTQYPTAKAVYDYVSDYAPTIEAIPSTCTAAAPCALVAAGDGAKWEPIQQ